MSVLCLLPYRAAASAWNMAADGALLAAADAGAAALRFYGWLAPTLSLGYFQPHAPARAYPGLQGLDWVRRPTGGAALLHHHEVTYALALPAGRDWQPPGRACLCHFHQMIVDALAGLGVSATLCQREEKRGEVLCFLHHTPGDVLIGGHKVAGSAQRKTRGALLQHGGILLARSEHTPQLPGIAELSGRSLAAEQVQGAVVARLREDRWTIEPGNWSAADEGHLQRALESRYTSRDWNERR
jgi:lipoate-protein ligase A